MLPELSLRELCGQLLVVGFDGPELPPELEQTLRRGECGGAILFRRNLPDIEATTRLCRQIGAAAPAGLPPFIAVDQEGGRVGRLPSPPALAVPPMRELARRSDPELCEKVGRAVGLELRALGFTMNFAPVVDVDSNPANPVIGDRAFGAEPETVTRFARAFMRGLLRAPIAACLKHFPGHGDTDLDSHFDLPFVRHPRTRLDRIEIEPFRALLPEALAVMSAHVVYSALDERPATLSHRIMTDLLRSELQFAGVAFSDDLEMRGLSDRFPAAESAVEAVKAGCDVLLVCHDRDLALRIQEALIREASRDEAFRARCVEAASRALLLRQRFPSTQVADIASVFEANQSIQDLLLA